MDGESLNLKSKFKTLIDKTKKNVSGGVGGNDLASGHDILSTAADSIALAAAERDRRSRKAFGGGSINSVTHPIPLTALEEDDVLQTMEEEYYNEKFNSSIHELGRFGEGTPLDQAGIDVQRQRLLRQLKVVSKRWHAQQMDINPRCNEEMVRVNKVEGQLQAALQVCMAARRGNHRARIFITSSLGILSAQKRRQRAETLLHYLKELSTLQRTDERLQELLKEENYPGAIQVLLEG